LHYGWHCFCRRCSLRFRERGWCRDWPRLANGAIDLANAALGTWRSEQVAGMVSQLGAVARAHGKRMLFDAKVSCQNGQDYELLRPHVDEFIETARYLGQAPGAYEYWHCVGLCRFEGRALPGEMRLNLLSALRAGARRLWITPSHYLSPAHWQQLDELMSDDHAASKSVH
jgi:hypothetical protein